MPNKIKFDINLPKKKLIIKEQLKHDLYRNTNCSEIHNLISRARFDSIYVHFFRCRVSIEEREPIPKVPSNKSIEYLAV